MIRKSAQERIKEIEARRTALLTELNRLSAREKFKNRKADTRRKILLGAWLLQQLGSDDAITAKLKRDLPRVLSRPTDRQLFESWL